MRLQYSTYHALLRVSAVVMTCVLVFQSGLIVPATEQLAHNTSQYLANAIGVKASITPTDVNTYSAQLSEFERELDEREALIAAREIEIGIDAGEAPATDTTTFLLSIILFILVVLIVLNYALDYLRSRPQTPIQQATDELATASQG